MAAILISVAILFFLGLLVYAGVENVKNATVSIDERLSERQTQSVVETPTMSYSLRDINSAKLFFVKKEVVKKKKVVKAKKTKLKLSLDGVIASKESGFSRAIIRTSNKKPVTYELGEKIEGTNANLQSVEASRVLIDRVGVLESLELERENIER